MKEDDAPTAPHPLASHLDTLIAAVRSVARRRRLSAENRKELLSYASCKLLERGEKVFSGYAGRARLRTYLESVVDRLWLDLANELWGRWRPTVKAQKLGKTAVDLDRFVRRDGLDPATALRSAIACNRSERPVEPLEKLAAELQPRSTSVPAESWPLQAPERTDDGLEERERRALARRLLGALNQLMAELPAVERLILRLRYLEERTAGEVAGLLRLPERSVYLTAYATLGRLARELESRGFDAGLVRRLTDQDHPALFGAR